MPRRNTVLWPVLSLALLMAACGQPAAAPTPAAPTPAVSASPGAPTASPAAKPASSPVASPVATPAASGPARRITVGTFSGTITNMPLYVAAAQGLDRQNGVELEIRELTNNVVLIQGLQTGDLQVVLGGEAALNAVSTGGAPFVFVAANQKGSPYQLIAQKNVKAWSDLKGGKILVGTKGSNVEVWTDLMLGANGLQRGDYSFLNNGNNPERYAALTTGQVQAAVLGQPFDLVALKEGYVSLGAPEDYVKDFEFNSMIIRRDWGEQNRSTVEGFLRAISASMTWLNDPANRGGTLALMKEKLKLEDEVNLQLYDAVFGAKKSFDPGMRLNKPAWQFFLDNLVASGELQSSNRMARFENMADDSYVDAALRGAR